MLEGYSRAAAADQITEGFPLGFTEGTIKLKIEFEAFDPQYMGKKVFRV
jgi:hypothetical protein